jgi:hypothetical protein
MSDRPVAETSTWQTHNTHKRQMPSAGFEPAIPAGERLQTHALIVAVNSDCLLKQHQPTGLYMDMDCVLCEAETGFLFIIQWTLALTGYSLPTIYRHFFCLRSSFFTFSCLAHVPYWKGKFLITLYICSPPPPPPLTYFYLTLYELCATRPPHTSRCFTIFDSDMAVSRICYTARMSAQTL